MVRVSDKALILNFHKIQEKDIDYFYINSTSQIMCNAITANQMAANSITANSLAANSILAQHISAGAVTADKVNVNQLSAISANMGTLTAGTISSNASINVGTNAVVGNNISVGNDVFIRGFGRINNQGSGRWIEFDGAGSIAMNTTLWATNMMLGGQPVATQQWVLQQIAAANS